MTRPSQAYNTFQDGGRIVTAVSGLSPVGVPMQPQRPTSVLVIAIFHFIIGGFGLVCGLIGAATLAAGGAVGSFGAPPPGAGAPQQQEMQDFQEKLKHRSEQEIPLQSTLAPVNMVLSLLLSVLLLVSGFGLLHVKPFGWWGSVVYGVVGLAMALYSLAFNLVYTLPISQRIMDEELKAHPQVDALAGPAMRAVLPVTSICVPILIMIYPNIVLIIMARSNVRAAFRGELTGSGDAGSPRDEGRRDDDYGQYPPGYGGEPDDRFGPGPR